MTKEELIQAISDDKMMPFIQPEQLARIVDFVIKNYEPSLPLNLGEVTMDFARELDFFLYGSYTPERFPNSMSVRDEHSGLNVNDWKCWVNRPELKIEMVKHFFTLGKQAGAEWMAGQGWFSVDEKLPELDEEVIVLTDEHNTAPIYKIGFGHIVDVERCIDYNGWNHPGVKYWMPCPKIPNND